MILEFIIPEKIIPKQSARFYADGYGRIRSYQPKKIKENEKLIQFYFHKQYPKFDIEQFKDKPLRLEILILMKISDSWSKKKKDEALKDIIRPTKKPDCDNMCKLIQDSLNRVAYPDDKQIVELSIKKYYAPLNRIEIKIESLENV